MIIHNLHAFPENTAVNDLTLAEIPVRELQPLIDKHVDEIWYWYGREGPDFGDGELIARQGIKYLATSLEHFDDEPIIRLTGYDRFKSFHTLAEEVQWSEAIKPLMNQIKHKYNQPSYNRKKLFIKPMR